MSTSPSYAGTGRGPLICGPLGVLTSSTELGMEQKSSFRKALYTDHVAKLITACNWLGIDRGRAAQYDKLIREFFEDDARSQQHILAYGESCEIVDLFELWEHRVTAFPQLSTKIRAVFNKGPLLREEENPAVSSNRPRNDAFGYLVAGRLLAAGIPVVAVEGIRTRDADCESEADVTFRWEGTLIDIECKRPQSFVALAVRTKEAREQIERPSRGGRYGIIALDCSVLVRPAGTLLGSDSCEADSRWIESELEKSIPSQVRPYLASLIPCFFVFARIPARTRIPRSPIVTALGEPYYDFRLDSISTLLVFDNPQYAGPDVFRYLEERLLEAENKPMK
jgi:hypothetical protein